MLDNLNIHIDELATDYFDDFEGKYLVDAWWTEEDDRDNKQYQLESPNERGTVIGRISEDGTTFEWSDNSFRGAIYNGANDNLWVLDEIEDAQRRIKAEYFNEQ